MCMLVSMSIFLFTAPATPIEVAPPSRAKDSFDSCVFLCGIALCQPLRMLSKQVGWRRSCLQSLFVRASIEIYIHSEPIFL